MFILIKSILDFDSLHIASIFLIHRSIEKYISYMRKNKTTVDVFYCRAFCLSFIQISWK